jgi:hypothetical protein
MHKISKGKCVTDWSTVTESDCKEDNKKYIVIKKPKRKCKEEEEEYLPLRLVVKSLYFLECEDEEDKKSGDCVPECNVELDINDATRYGCNGDPGPPQSLSDINYKFVLPIRKGCTPCGNKITEVHASVEVTGIQLVNSGFPSVVGDIVFQIFNGSRLVASESFELNDVNPINFDFMGVLEDIDVTLPLTVRFAGIDGRIIRVSSASIRLIVIGSGND